MKFSSRISRLATDIMINTITEDISALTERIQQIIEDLKANDSPLLESEILRHLRYNGFLINEVIIKTVRDALQLESEEIRHKSED